jgi:hypothetical protein
MDERDAGWLSIRLWTELLLWTACGRVLLALLPRGYVGSHRLPLRAITLVVSMVLGGIVQGMQIVTGEWSASTAGCVAAGILAVGAIVWSAGPRAFVPQREPFAVPRSRLETAANVAVLAACFVPILRSGTPFAAPILLTCVIVLHALAIADRRALGAAVAVLAFVPLPALASPYASHGPGMLVALGAGALIAWLRRADRRSRSLAAIGYAALAAFSLPAGAAGFASAFHSVHRNARRAFAIEVALATAVITAPRVWQRVALRSGAPSEPWPWVRDVHVGIVAPAVAVALALAVLAGWRGRAGASAAEARPVAVFLVLAVVLHALAAASPWADVLGARSWDVIGTLSLPAGALLAGLVLVPERSTASGNGAS